MDNTMRITKVIANVYDGTDSGRMLEGDRIFVAKRED